MKNLYLSILCCLMVAVNAMAQSSYDAMAPFGFATCTSRTDAGNVSNITGGGCYAYPVPSDVAAAKRVVTLQSTGSAMDAEIKSAIINNDIIIFDGSQGDFILEAYVEMKNLSDKTILGINNARLCTKWYATDEDVAALEAARVSKMSTSGGGSTLVNGESVTEEAEYNTRKIMIERYNDTSEWWRKSGIFYISSCTNIIVRNLKLQGPGAMDLGGADLLSVINSCKNIWVDHCEFYDGQDGNFDITNYSDMVTVSWCTFSYTGRSYMHQNTNLCGSSDSKTDDDDKLSITWAYNMWGQGCAARMPMARFGRFHMLNNYYNCAGNKTSCMNPRINSEFLIEGNYFESNIQKIYEASSPTKVIWRGDNVCGSGISSSLPSVDNSTAATTLIPYAYTKISPTSPTVKNQVLAYVGATIFVDQNKSTKITATVDGVEAAFVNDSYTYSFDAPDAKLQYAVVLTLPDGATVSSVSGAILASGTTYNITAPAEGSTVSATFTITSADGTANQTYTISLKSVSNVKYSDVKTSGTTTIYYWNTGSGSTTKSNFKVVTGNYKPYPSGSEISYSGSSYKYGLKMESSTEAVLTITEQSDVVFVFDTSSKRFYLNGTTCTTNSDKVYSTRLESGTYTITKQDSPILVAVYVTPAGSTPLPTLYTVTYNANNLGICSTANWTQTSEGQSTNLPAATANSGYTFLGWATSSSATTAQYSAGESYTPIANVTLYAVYRQEQQGGGGNVEYTLSSHGYTANNPNTGISYTIPGTYVALIGNTDLTIGTTTDKGIKMRTGNASFSGTSTSLDGTKKFEIDVNSGYAITAVEFIAANVYANISELTGVYVDGDYTHNYLNSTVSFGSDKSSNSGSVSGFTAREKIEFAVTTTSVESENGTQLNFLAAITYEEVADDDPKNDDATLSALKYNGVTVPSFSSDVDVYDVVLAAGTVTVPTVTYTLSDSNASANITNAASLPGTSTVTVTAENGTTIKTYTINFTVAVQMYDVKFYDDASQVGETQSIEDGQTVNAPSNPTKSGYTFRGWSETNGGSTPVVFPYTVTANKNFYAIWEEIEEPVPSTGDNVDSDGNVICNTFWKFSDDGFDSSYSESKTVRGLTVNGASGKVISIDNSNKTLDELSFTKCLKFGGTGDTSSRNVSFKVVGPCTIEVWGMSSHSTDLRSLVIRPEKSTVSNILNQVGNTLTKGIYEYNGTGETIYLYSSSSGFNIYGIRVTYPDYSLTVSSALWASLYLPYAVTVPTGVKAYYGSNVGDTSIALDEIADVIPAKTGVLVNANAGTYSFKPASSKGQNVSSVFCGVTADTNVADLKTKHSTDVICTLGRNSGVIGIYKYNGTTVKQNSIYLPATPVQAAKGVSMIMRGVVTGIDGLEYQRSDNGYSYNLFGQKVKTASAKGVVIKNGKKIVIR